MYDVIQVNYTDEITLVVGNEACDLDSGTQFQTNRQTDRQITKELVPLLYLDTFYTHANMFNRAANVLAMLCTKQCVARYSTVFF